MQEARRDNKFGDWLNEWLDNYVKPTVKDGTYKKYERIVRLHLIPKFGDRELDALTVQAVQAYISELCGAYSSNTVNGVINVINGALKQAMSVGVMSRSIVGGIKRPKPSEKQIECFSSVEQKQIEDHILRCGKDKLFGILLCLYTGLRIGELLALKWEDIDLSTGLLSVKKTCYDAWENGKYIKKLDDPKTAGSRRVIPLPKQLAAYLKALKKRSKSDMIVSSESGGQVSIRSYQRTFELVQKRLGIKRKGFHALRHTFATRALECGMDVKTLSEILGHKNPTVTLKRYTHSLMEHKAAMMDKLGKLLDMPATKKRH